jgi:hypothetical protein
MWTFIQEGIIIQKAIIIAVIIAINIKINLPSIKVQILIINQT